MPTTGSARKSSRERARAYRQRMRAKGLRPVQFWLPDVNSPEFIAEAHRQSLAISNSPHAEEDQAFIDALTDWDDE
jgi:DNA-binding LacI/PurR family transcriptional regulator